MDEASLQALADRIAVEDLLTRYATAVDRRDWELYRSVFTTDAEVDYTTAVRRSEASVAERSVPGDALRERGN